MTRKDQEGRSASGEASDSLRVLPPDLPVPTDDGAASHLPGTGMPLVQLRASDGSRVDLGDLPTGRSVVFVYPATSRPTQKMPQGWDAIPGARGCTTELCGIQDEITALRRAGAHTVLGLSTQDWWHQRETAQRLGLSYPLLADPTGRAGRDLRLPTFKAGTRTFYQRLTLVVQDGVIEHVFYPVFPPDTHAAEVIAWLRGRRH